MFWVYLVIYLLLIAVGIFVLIISCKGYKKENSLVGEVVTTTVITTGEPGLMYNEYGGNAEVELQVAPEIVIEVEEPIIEFEAPVEIEIQVDVDANVEVEIEAPIEGDIQGDVEIEVNL